MELVIKFATANHKEQGEEETDVKFVKYFTLVFLLRFIRLGKSYVRDHRLITSQNNCSCRIILGKDMQ